MTALTYIEIQEIGPVHELKENERIWSADFCGYKKCRAMSFDHMWALMVKQTSIGLITIYWYQKNIDSIGGRQKEKNLQPMDQYY